MGTLRIPSHALSLRTIPLFGLFPAPAAKLRHGAPETQKGGKISPAAGVRLLTVPGIRKASAVRFSFPECFS